MGSAQQAGELERAKRRARQVTRNDDQVKRYLIILIAGIAILSIAIGGLIGYDIYKDRQNIIVTAVPVLAYANWESYPTKEMKPLFVLPAKTNARVRRIRYGKDYMAVRVESEKGEQGWVFYYGDSFIIRKGT